MDQGSQAESLDCRTGQRNPQARNARQTESQMIKEHLLVTFQAVLSMVMFLKNTLTDHAEDFEKVTAVRTVQSGIAEAVRDSKAKNQGGERDGGGNDPISMIQEHLQQQDGKMSELDLKLSEQDRQMKVVQRQLGELIAMLRK